MYRIKITKLAPNPMYKELIAERQRISGYGMGMGPEPKEFTELTAFECDLTDREFVDAKVALLKSWDTVEVK